MKGSPEAKAIGRKATLASMTLEKSMGAQAHLMLPIHLNLVVDTHTRTGLAWRNSGDVAALERGGRHKSRSLSHSRAKVVAFACFIPRDYRSN